MKKAEFVAMVAGRTGLTRKDAEQMVDTVFDCLGEVLAKQDKLGVPGFGTFSTKTRQARIGRNPATGQEVEIPETQVPVFKPAKRLKEEVEGHASR